MSSRFMWVEVVTYRKMGASKFSRTWRRGESERGCIFVIVRVDVIRVLMVNTTRWY